MIKNISEFTNELFDRAKARLEEFEIYASSGESFSVGVLGGKIDKYSVNTRQGISLRVKCGKKMGYAATTSTDTDGIDDLIKRAEENAALIETEDEQFIFKGSDHYTYPKVYGEKLESFTEKDKIEFALELERRALAKDPRIIRVQSCQVMSGGSTVIIKNSNGLDLSERSNFAGAYVTPIAQIGDSMNSGFGSTAGFSPEELDMDKAVEEAVVAAIDLCGAPSMPSTQSRIVFRASALSDMIGTFAGIFSAESAQRGLSLLLGKEGERIASEAVTIVDDPTVDFGYSSRAFDAEGVASKRNVVIENGVLRTLLYNLKTAHKAGVESTGNATKGDYSSPIGTFISNFILLPGETDYEGLLAEMKDGFVITDVSGLHAGANAATGDFSLLAQGYKVTDGKEESAVAGITISGNFYKLLLDIETVGSDVYSSPFGASVSCPSVLLSSTWSLAGK